MGTCATVVPAAYTLRFDFELELASLLAPRSNRFAHADRLAYTYM